MYSMHLIMSQIPRQLSRFTHPLNRINWDGDSIIAFIENEVRR